MQAHVPSAWQTWPSLPTQGSPTCSVSTTHAPGVFGPDRQMKQGLHGAGQSQELQSTVFLQLSSTWPHGPWQLPAPGHGLTGSSSRWRSPGSHRIRWRWRNTPSGSWPPVSPGSSGSMLNPPGNSRASSPPVRRHARPDRLPSCPSSCPWCRPLAHAARAIHPTRPCALPRWRCRGTGWPRRLLPPLRGSSILGKPAASRCRDVFRPTWRAARIQPRLARIRVPTNLTPDGCDIRRAVRRSRQPG